MTEAIPMCAELGIKEALLTVKNDNHASIAIIKKCGGKLQDEYYDEAHKRTSQRWIIKS